MDKKNQKLKKNSTSQKVINEERKIGKLFSKNWFIISLFIIITSIVYSNSFTVPFQFDDDQQILLRESNHSLHNFSNLSYWLNVNNRPVSTFTLVLNYVLHGENVFGYHLVNLIIHLLSGIILFFFLKLIFSLRGDKETSKWLPFVIALFFLIHPVQIQSVTYIVQRMTSLAGMFFILAVLFYARGRIVYLKNGLSKEAIGYYVIAAVAGVMGTFSKQNAVVFPLAMLLTELFFIRDNNGRICKRYLVAVAAIGIIISTIVLLIFGIPRETKNITSIQYLATQMTIIPRYFQMMLLPFGLSIDHGVKVVKNIFDLKVIGGASFLIGILVFAFFQIKKRPLVSFGIFWIFIALIVESSIFPIRDVMFDQRMYLPLAGFLLSFWTLVFEFLFKKNKRFLSLLILAALLGLSVWTYARNNVWQSNVKIWEDVTRKYPNYFRGWQGLGREYLVSGEKDASKIVYCYEKALEIEPNNLTVLNDLAANYLKIKEYPKAMNCCMKLIDCKVLAYKLNSFRILGIIYLETKQYDLAIKYLEKLVEIEYKDTAALQNLSGLYIQKGDYKKAIYYAEETLKVSPKEVIALLNIGFSRINMGESELSKKYILKALKIEPQNTRGLILYANACINTGKFDEAISNLKSAYNITKDDKLLKDIEKVEKMFKSNR